LKTGDGMQISSPLYVKCFLSKGPASAEFVNGEYSHERARVLIERVAVAFEVTAFTKYSLESPVSSLASPVSDAPPVSGGSPLPSNNIMMGV